MLRFTACQALLFLGGVLEVPVRREQMKRDRQRVERGKPDVKPRSRAFAAVAFVGQFFQELQHVSPAAFKAHQGHSGGREGIFSLP